MHILRSTGLQHIVLEVYFDEAEFFPLQSNLEHIIKMMVTGYNLTEPEHSRDFPLVQIDILLPQIFDANSALITDGLVSHVYYNPETDPTLPKKLIAQRKEDQTKEALVSVVPIDQIKDEALAIGVQLVRPSLAALNSAQEQAQTADSLVANLQETDISERT